MHRDHTRQPRFGLLLLAAWSLVLLQLMAQYWPMTAVTMPDADDALRLVQVRDFLAGQSWFDLHQPRLAPPVGYDSHWSRLIDAGLAGLFLVFTVVVSEPLAERLMTALWPVLWLLPTIGAAVAIAWRLAGREGLYIVLLLAVFGLPGMGQFRPGRIDHHNVQIAFAVLTVAATVWSDRIRWACWAAGALTGLALAIGFEGLPILILCGAAFVLRYVLDGNAAPAMRAYGAALAASTLGAFLASVSPAHWSRIACDAIAINTAAGAIMGGLALVAVSFVTLSSRASRFALASVAGALALTAFAALEPRCLAGPYALMDPALRTLWLAHMSEMQPLGDLMRKMPVVGVATAAFPLLALVALALVAQRVELRRDFGFLVAAGAFVLAFVIMIGVTKIYSYALWLGVPLVAAAILHLFQRFALNSLVVRFAVVLLMTPTAFTFGAMQIASATVIAGASAPGAGSPTARDTCIRRDSYAALAQIPTGLVVTNELEWGPFVLAWTPHSVLAAPYHRMSDAILTAYRIFALPPPEAHAILKEHHVTYVVTCGEIGASDLDAEQTAASLGGRMQAGDIPAWLAPMGQTQGQAMKAYRVKP